MQTTARLPEPSFKSPSLPFYCTQLDTAPVFRQSCDEARVHALGILRHTEECVINHLAPTHLCRGKTSVAHDWNSGIRTRTHGKKHLLLALPPWIFGMPFRTHAPSWTSTECAHLHFVFITSSASFAHVFPSPFSLSPTSTNTWRTPG